MDDKDYISKDKNDMDITMPTAGNADGKTDRDRSNSVYVTIDRKVKDSIDKYAASDTSRELGGVLIGSYKEKDGCFHVYIKAEIVAKHTKAAKSNIKFTHETWADIDQVKETNYPDEKIVGWFHTHPGFGVFLSEYDLFIQNNFFNFPFQVAYVVDPVKGTSGFFGNAEGKIINVNYKINEDDPYSKRRPAVTGYSSSKGIQKLKILSYILLFLLLISAAVNYFFYHRLNNLSAREDSLREQLIEKDGIIYTLENDISELLLDSDAYKNVIERYLSLFEKIRKHDLDN